MTRALIELLWFIGCMCFICFLFVCLNSIMSISHNDLSSSLGRTLFMSFLFMLMFIPHSELAMEIFKYIYNFLRMCFGDEMNRIGRLQSLFMATKTKAGAIYAPLILFSFLYCFIRHFITARKGARKKALIFLPAIFAVESIIIMCTIDRIISFILLILFFITVLPGINLNASNNKGFTNKYFHNNYKKNKIERYSLVSQEEMGNFGDPNLAHLRDEKGNVIPVYKDANGVVSDVNGNIFEPE